MIASPNWSSRRGRKVRLIVIHTAEGARTVESLGRYFGNPSAKSSSHVGIDDTRMEHFVPPDQASWTLRSGNAISENAELCGFAGWSRTVWLRDHQAMLRMAAEWIRDRCNANNIPMVKLTPAEVKAGKAGVIGHHDWTVGMKDGTHTDPGPGFPWDVVMSMASGWPQSPTPHVKPAAREDDPVFPIAIRVDELGTFHETVCLDAGNSRYVAHASILFGSTWGWTRMVVTAIDHAGVVLDTWVKELADNRFDSAEIPAKTKLLTVEGDVERPTSVTAADGSVAFATRPAATVLLKAA